eukprot:1143078-Pelagomonas_calceolata.AAC.1
MKSLRRDALLGGAELKGAGTECALLSNPEMGNPGVLIAFVANSKLAWAPISMMPLGFHSKVVTGKA